jgi:hypothetical protein
VLKFRIAKAAMNLAQKYFKESKLPWLEEEI